MLPVPVAFPLGHPREILGWTPSGSLILGILSFTVSLLQLASESVVQNGRSAKHPPYTHSLQLTRCKSPAVLLRTMPD